MYIVGIIILTFFAAIGLAEFICALTQLKCRDDMSLLLTNLKGNDAEVRVRHAAELCRRIRCERLICECSDDEAKIICEKLRESDPQIIVKYNYNSTA